MEVELGKMIQRTTLPIVSGVMEEEEMAETNWGIGTERDKRRTVQSGILEIYVLNIPMRSLQVETITYRRGGSAGYQNWASASDDCLVRHSAIPTCLAWPTDTTTLLPQG